MNNLGSYYQEIKDYENMLKIIIKHMNQIMIMIYFLQILTK